MLMKFFRKRKKEYYSIDPSEIFLDSINLPGFDDDRFEGRIEKPIKDKSVYIVGFFFFMVLLIFTSKIFNVQVINGQENFDKSKNNSLRHTYVFSDRGIIYDRSGKALAWNSENQNEDFNKREYVDKEGFSNILGYVSYPKKDSSGFYFDTEIIGVDGFEKVYNDLLAGENGLKITETDAVNNLVSDSLIYEPESGKNVHLTIDSDLQENLYLQIKKIADERGFRGGGGAIMDIQTGEMIAMVSYPEFNSTILSEGSDKEKIAEYTLSERKPFLNRITQGLYTPGSIVKPFMAIAALNEGVIDINTNVLSTGKMIIPNPYNPDNPSVFTDWKAHGYVNVIKALAMSSNIFFYQIGGGFQSQQGIGIEKINDYMHEFGFGRPIGNSFFTSPVGVIPNPKWKKENFDGDDWRLGDTYFTSIGQYGFQVTPIQVLRAIASIANNGTVVEPKILADDHSINIFNQIDIAQSHFNIVKRGMREVVESGTASGLNSPYYHVAAKTGTAELGVSKANVNSWITGFFPYENPKYAFVVVMEEGSVSNLVGGVAVSRNFFDWLYYNKPEYLDPNI